MTRDELANLICKHVSGSQLDYYGAADAILAAHPSRPVEGTDALKAKIAAMVGWNVADGDPLDVLLSALSAPATAEDTKLAMTVRDIFNMPATHDYELLPMIYAAAIAYAEKKARAARAPQGRQEGE